MILAVDEITMDFGGLRALSGVSMAVEQGTITGLIGPNGSGKTTMFNIISGYYRPTSGNVSFKGEAVTRYRPYALAKRGMSRTFQSVLLFEERTVLENIVLAKYCSRPGNWLVPLFLDRVITKIEDEDQHAALEILEFLQIEKYRDEQVKNVPFGTRHFLEIGKCIATDPSLILLDEPTTGLNTAEQTSIMALIKDLKQKGITILIVEHNMRVVMNICDYLNVLDMGNKIAEGPPETVRNDKNVIRSYLGKGASNA